MGWNDSTFPDANDPSNVGWMIMYWRTVPCQVGYRLESRQFDHLDKSATLEEAEEKLAEYVANRRKGGKAASIKNHALFLCKVAKVIRISDETGELVDD